MIKKLPILAFSVASLLLTPMQQDQLFAEKKEKSAKRTKKIKLREGGRFYQNAPFSIGTGKIIASYKGASYQAHICPKGVIHVFSKSGEYFNKRPTLLIEPSWVDGKDRKADEAYLNDLSFDAPSNEQWILKGDFKSPKGSYQAAFKFSDQSISIQSDANVSKTGNLKLTMTTTNFQTLYKQDIKKRESFAKKAIFTGKTSKKKTLKSNYLTGDLKEHASHKYSNIELKEHFPNSIISFDASKSEGQLDLKAYGGGRYLMEGFNVRYQTPSKGNINLDKNTFTITFK